MLQGKGKSIYYTIIIYNCILYNYTRKINIFSIGSTKTDFREMS